MRRASRKVKARQHIRMDLHTRGDGRMEAIMEKVNSYGRQMIAMKENFKIIRDMGLEFGCGRMEPDLKEIGKRISVVVMESFYTVMDLSIKENSHLGREMDED